MSELIKRKLSDVLDEDSSTDSSIIVESQYKKTRINKQQFTDEELLDHYRKNRTTKKESRYCRYSCCEKQASFGPKSGPRLRCATHKLSTDVNNRARICEHDGCTIQASFGPIESIKVFRCGTHKLVNDINKTNPMCIFKDCDLTASFGPPKGNKLTCLAHKEKDYINLKKFNSRIK